MRPNKDHRTEIILYGLLLIPLLFAAAALAQATEQAQGLAEITAVLSEILHTPSMLRWCASTPKFLLAVLVLYPLAVYCYMLDQADRHPGAEHGTAKWGSAHRLNIKYRNTKDSKENYILTENVRFSTDSHAHKHNLNIIVIGGSGSGKTRFYVKPNALQLIGSYLFLDPKGELTRTLGRIMETKGISVTVLDLVHFQGHYNPMAYLETDEDAMRDDECLLLMRSEDPVIDKKYNLLHHPNVKYTPDAGGEPYVMPPDYMGDAVTITMDAVAAATAPEITEEMYEQLDYLEKHPEENYYENEENFSQYDQGD